MHFQNEAIRLSDDTASDAFPASFGLDRIQPQTTESASNAINRTKQAMDQKNEALFDNLKEAYKQLRKSVNSEEQNKADDLGLFGDIKADNFPDTSGFIDDRVNVIRNGESRFRSLDPRRGVYSREHESATLVRSSHAEGSFGDRVSAIKSTSTANVQTIDIPKRDCQTPGGDAPFDHLGIGFNQVPQGSSTFLEIQPAKVFQNSVTSNNQLFIQDEAQFVSFPQETSLPQTVIFPQSVEVEGRNNTGFGEQYAQEQTRNIYFQTADTAKVPFGDNRRNQTFDQSALLPTVKQAVPESKLKTQGIVPLTVRSPVKPNSLITPPSAQFLPRNRCHLKHKSTVISTQSDDTLVYGQSNASKPVGIKGKCDTTEQKTKPGVWYPEKCSWPEMKFPNCLQLIDQRLPQIGVSGDSERTLKLVAKGCAGLSNCKILIVPDGQVNFAVWNGRHAKITSAEKTDVFLGWHKNEKKFLCVKLYKKEQAPSSEDMLCKATAALFLNETFSTPKFYGVVHVSESAPYTKLGMVEEFIGNNLVPTTFKTVVDNMAHPDVKFGPPKEKFSTLKKAVRMCINILEQLQKVISLLYSV